jgi:hypothetical protein
MRFAISIPQHTADGAFDPAGVRRYLARAEELGFAGAWTQEQVLGTIPHLGPVELLSECPPRSAVSTASSAWAT